MGTGLRILLLNALCFMTIIFCVNFLKLEWISLVDQLHALDVQKDLQEKKAPSTSERLSIDDRLSILNSIKHVTDLFDRAAVAAQSDETIYGTLSTPLIAFLTPKTGANTIRRVIEQSLAKTNNYFSTGCKPELSFNITRTSCLRNMENVGNISCGVAFADHLHPDSMKYGSFVKMLSLVDQDENRRCTRWPNQFLDVRGVLQRLVCTNQMRHPVSRLISGWYEFHYMKSSNLTAIQYLRQHGPEAYITGTLQAQSNWITRDTLESCLVGVTERMDEFITILSRVLYISPPEAPVTKVRHHDAIGMNASDFEFFHEQLTPFLSEEINVYYWASNISRAQYELALQYDPVMNKSQQDLLKDAECQHCCRLENEARVPGTVNQCWYSCDGTPENSYDYGLPRDTFKNSWCHS